MSTKKEIDEFLSKQQAIYNRLISKIPNTKHREYNELISEINQLENEINSL